MSFSSTIKKILKFFILTAFLLDRYWYYIEFRAIESDTRDLHHQLVGGYEINFGKVQRKYDNHHLFTVPLVKTATEKFKNYLESKFNLNQTISHERHIHSKDAVHSYQNKVIYLETKFNFCFLTAYDLLISTLLIILSYSNSLAINIYLLADSALKILSICNTEWKDLRLVLLYNSIYSFINDVMKKDYRASFEDLTKFVLKEETLALNLFMLGLLLLLFFVNSATKKRREEVIPEETSKMQEIIESTAGTSLQNERNEEEQSKIIQNIKKSIEYNKPTEDIKIKNKNGNVQDINNLKTVESEGNVEGNIGKSKSASNFPEIPSIKKIVPFEGGNELRKKSRENTPSRRRKNERPIL